MRRPAGRLAVAPPMISRPAMRTVTLSKLNMMALVQRNASSRSAVRDVDLRRCRKKVGDEDHHLAAFPYQSHPFAMAEPGRGPIPGEGRRPGSTGASSGLSRKIKRLPGGREEYQ